MIEWGRRAQRAGRRWVHTYHLPYFPEHARNGLEPWQQEVMKPSSTRPAMLA